MQSTIHHQNHHQRRLTTRLQISPKTSPLHQRLPQIFSGRVPSHTSSGENDTPPDDNKSSTSSSENDQEDKSNLTRTSASFLPSQTLSERTVYARRMHAHTTSQMSSPSTGTVPSYTRTMHAFTLNQLNHMADTSTNTATRQNEKRNPALSPNNAQNSNTTTNHQPPKPIPPTTNNHKSHLLTTLTQPLNLKLPPLPPTSNPTTTTTTTTTTPPSYASNPQPVPSTPELHLRPPTNTPEPDISAAPEAEAASLLPPPPATSLYSSSSARSTLAAELRACEQELERRFRRLGAVEEDSRRVGVGGGSGVEGFLGGGGGGRAEVRDFAVR
ncbi:hypothetical protein Q7P37_005201 [Cladosporium fusiforme]